MPSLREELGGVNDEVTQTIGAGELTARDDEAVLLLLRDQDRRAKGLERVQHALELVRLDDLSRCFLICFLSFLYSASFFFASRPARLHLVDVGLELHARGREEGAEQGKVVGVGERLLLHRHDGVGAGRLNLRRHRALLPVLEPPGQPRVGGDDHVLAPHHHMDPAVVLRLQRPADLVLDELFPVEVELLERLADQPLRQCPGSLTLAWTANPIFSLSLARLHLARVGRPGVIAAPAMPVTSPRTSLSRSTPVSFLNSLLSLRKDSPLGPREAIDQVDERVDVDRPRHHHHRPPVERLDERRRPLAVAKQRPRKLALVELHAPLEQRPVPLSRRSSPPPCRDSRRCAAPGPAAPLRRFSQRLFSLSTSLTRSSSRLISSAGAPRLRASVSSRCAQFSIMGDSRSADTGLHERGEVGVQQPVGLDPPRGRLLERAREFARDCDGSHRRDGPRVVDVPFLVGEDQYGEGLAQHHRHAPALALEHSPSRPSSAAPAPRRCGPRCRAPSAGTSPGRSACNRRRTPPCFTSRTPNPTSPSGSPRWSAGWPARRCRTPKHLLEALLDEAVRLGCLLLHLAPLKHLRRAREALALEQHLQVRGQQLVRIINRRNCSRLLRICTRRRRVGGGRGVCGVLGGLCTLGAARGEQERGQEGSRKGGHRRDGTASAEVLLEPISRRDHSLHVRLREARESPIQQRIGNLDKPGQSPIGLASRPNEQGAPVVRIGFTILPSPPSAAPLTNRPTVTSDRPMCLGQRAGGQRLLLLEEDHQRVALLRASHRSGRPRQRARQRAARSGGAPEKT